jgi:hypothetical protein
MAEIEQKIELERVKFMTFYKKQRLMNNIALVVSLVLIITVYLVIQAIFSQNLIALGSVALILLMLFIFSKVTRPKMEAATKAYIEVYYNLLSNIVFPVSAYPDVKVDPQGKLAIDTFADSGFLKNVSRINSRALTTVTLGGHSALVCDLAVYAKADKKQMPVFLGKFISADNTQKTDGRLLIYRKSKVAGKGPDMTDDVKLVEDNEQHTIYATEGNTKKWPVEAIISALDSLDIGDILTDCALSIKDGKTTILLSYSDALMVIPLQTPFVPHAINHYASDLCKITEIIGLIK